MPSSRVWENIMAAGIDTSAHTASKAYKRKYWIYSLSAAIALTLIALIFLQQEPIAKIYNQISVLEKSYQINKPTNAQEPIESQEPLSKKANIESNTSSISQSISNSLLTLIPKSNISLRQNNLLLASTRNPTNFIARNNIENSEFQNSDLTVNESSQQNDQLTIEERNTFIPELQRIETVFNTFDNALTGIYVGVNGGYNYTTIVESNPVGYDNTPIVSTGKFGPSKGISVGYNFNQTFGIQLDYNYNSIEGTNYSIEPNSNNKKSLQLIYDQIPLTFKFRIPQMNYLNHRLKILNLYTGIQYNRLKEYHLPQEQRYDKVEDPLNKNTISFVAGFNYDINVLPSLYLSLGARGLISSNIASSSYPISDNQSHSFSVGARVGIIYQFNTHK
ncbi:MAG: porin family protein [Chitinophagales bacterium]|nr:porin family protein [Chitinophagales bacterium]